MRGLSKLGLALFGAGIAMLVALMVVYQIPEAIRELGRALQ
jgi:hypothetical protein